MPCPVGFSATAVAAGSRVQVTVHPAELGRRARRARHEAITVGRRGAAVLSAAARTSTGVGTCAAPQAAVAPSPRVCSAILTSVVSRSPASVGPCRSAAIGGRARTSASCTRRIAPACSNDCSNETDSDQVASAHDEVLPRSRDQYAHATGTIPSTAAPAEEPPSEQRYRENEPAGGTTVGLKNRPRSGPSAARRTYASVTHRPTMLDRASPRPAGHDRNPASPQRCTAS